MSIPLPMALAISSALGLFVWRGPDVADYLRERLRPAPFQPPPCYVCGYPGPMGELAPKLPCCVVCREAVMRELDAILDPFKEARDREERRLAEARAVTDFATKFGMLPPRGLETQELAMRLGAPVEVLQLQYPRDSATAVLAQYLRQIGSNDGQRRK